MSTKDNLPVPASDDPSEQDQIETELGIQKKVKGYDQATIGLTYAADFRLFFSSLFEEARKEGKESFFIDKAVFDNFIVNREDCPFARVPTVGSDEWTSFVGHREKRRQALNRAAEVGQHGEPPYTVDVHYTDRPPSKRTGKKQPRMKDKNRYIVRLFDQMARLRQPAMAAAMQRFMENKYKGLQKFRAMCHARLDELSPESRIAFKQQERAFSYVIQDATIHLQRYLDDVRAIQDDIHQELGLDKTEPKKIPVFEE